MAVQSKVENDKIQQKLDDKVMKRQTLERRLERNDYDNEEIVEFLKLSKR